jgi:hypothetical protein
LSKECDTKWEVITRNCTGPAPSGGHECDKTTGKYVCKKGFFGDNCDFRSSESAATAAYDGFFDACYEGRSTYGNVSLQYPTIVDSCKRLNTQPYIPDDLKNNFYDVINQTNQKYNDIGFRNSAEGIDRDGEYSRDFSTRSLAVNGEIAQINSNNINTDANNTVSLNEQRKIRSERSAIRDGIKTDLSTPFTPDETQDPIKKLRMDTALAAGALRGQLSGKNGEITKNRGLLNTLTTTYADIKAKIAKFGGDGGAARPHNPPAGL